MDEQAPLHENFRHTTYSLRRRFLTLAGAQFHILSPDDRPLFFSKLKAFRLREDIRLYRDESQTEELLLIKARQIIDFSAAYDVTDPATGTVLGALRRKGFKSMFRDHWEVLDPYGNVVGDVKEDGQALLRRFIPFANLIPQTYTLRLGGQAVATLKQRFNLFLYKLDVTVHDPSVVDPRLPVAAAILLGAIEGKQE
jgi:hypothetical protein